jgi:N-acetyl-alpha-D-muramate 1-phosphate uridylyltransferase
MVMAAGLGKRMLPLTQDRPKPLVEVGGKPLIDHNLLRLVAAGVSHAVVNVHYRAEMVEAHLGAQNVGLRISISDERALLLETGGGLMKAEPVIDCDPFLCINSDNLWTESGAPAISRLADAWRDGDMDFLLLVVPREAAHCHAGRGDFHVAGDGRLIRRAPDEAEAPFVFTGVQMIAKRALVDSPTGPFSTNIFWDRAIKNGRCYGVVHAGQWVDVGTPAAIPVAETVLQNE